MTLARRRLLGAGGALGAAGLLQLFHSKPASAEPTHAAAAVDAFEVTRSEQEWRALLGAQQYGVLREQRTERPFSSALDKERRSGTYACAGCQLPLFSSATKFDSGTGWPSFWKPLENAVATHTDAAWGMARTEVHCRRCGGHLGHVFDDGPRPTGLRYCMNGIAMSFMSTAA